MKTKPVLIILSDLWGKAQADWVAHYTTYLKDNFEITYYDCCALGDIDTSNNTEHHLHDQFINGGIQKAIDKLILIEKRTVMILAFSIGGYIGWKATMAGLNTQYLFAVSATRLRYESTKPNVDLELYYGENDKYKPENQWFENLNIVPNIIEDEGHDFYKKHDFAKWLASRIVSKIENNS